MISIAPVFSLITLQWTFGFSESTLKPLRFISLRISITGIAYDRPVYSLSVLESVISVCIWDFQMMEHLWYDTMYPCQDLAVLRSHVSFFSQLPAMSASTNTFNSLALEGRSMSPFSQVPFRYWPNHRRALACSTFGAVVNLSNRWVINEMSLLVPLSR